MSRVLGSRLVTLRRCFFIARRAGMFVCVRVRRVRVSRVVVHGGGFLPVLVLVAVAAVGVLEVLGTIV